MVQTKGPLDSNYTKDPLNWYSENNPTSLASRRRRDGGWGHGVFLAYLTPNRKTKGLSYL